MNCLKVDSRTASQIAKETGLAVPYVSRALTELEIRGLARRKTLDRRRNREFVMSDIGSEILRSLDKRAAGSILLGSRAPINQQETVAELDDYAKCQELMEVGQKLLEMGRLNEAARYYTECRRICEKSGSQHTLMRVLQDLALVHFLSSEFDKSVHIAKRIARDASDPKVRAEAYAMLGYIYERTRRADDAIECLEEALRAVGIEVPLAAQGTQGKKP